MSNPYAPTEMQLVPPRIPPGPPGPPSLNWLAISMAFVIFSLLGIIIGFGIIMYFTFEVLPTMVGPHRFQESFLSSYDQIIAKGLSYVPSFMGAIYLGLHVNSRALASAIIYTSGVMFISCLPRLFWIYFNFTAIYDLYFAFVSTVQAAALIGCVMGIVRLRGKTSLENTAKGST